MLVFLLGSSAFAQVRVMTGDVKDTRRTDGFFSRLEIELRLIGDSLADAKALRVFLDKAVDETGRDLIDPENKEPEFEEIGSYGRGDKVDLQMKNPSRKALFVKEISGRVEIYIPKRDPKASIVLTNALKNTGQNVPNPALKAAGIELTVWTKEQYDARRKTEEARLKKEIEEKRKQAKEAGELDDPSEAMLDGLMKIFGGMFSTLSEMGENSIALQVTDTKGKLINIEFEDAAGKPISRQGSSSFGSSQTKTRIYEFEEKLPSNARIRLNVMTPRSIVTSPFNLTNIPLP